MSRTLHLKRRPSGVYVVRLVVPASLRAAVGQTEVHRSTGCRDLALAKIVAAEMAAQWHGRIAATKKMDPKKLIAGSVKLLGTGHIQLLDAARELGTTPAELAERLLALRADFWVQAQGWDGWLLPNIYDLEREQDALGETTAFVTSAAALALVGSVSKSSELLRVAFREEIQEMVRTGTDQGVCIFLRAKITGPAFVVEYPGVVLGLSALLTRREDVESLRADLAVGLSEIAASARAGEGQHSHAARLGDSIAKAKHFDKPVSALAAHYLEQRGPTVKADELRRQKDACAALVELTDDIALGEIERDTIFGVAKLLQRVPHRRDLVRRKFGSSLGWKQLIEVADKNGLPSLTPGAVERVLEDIHSIFEWGVTQSWLRENPTRGMSVDVFRQMGGVRKLDHERRDMFSTSDLRKIFCADWFLNGVGPKTKSGNYFSYRPHYYWLPLLGLYAGGRINELAQLYLNDIRDAGEFGWYFDFNLNDPDKVNSDELDAASDFAVSAIEHAGANKSGQVKADDKSLKTVSSHRLVPVHPILIDLGLIEYIRLLRIAGYQRLFPELRHDLDKGYGKDASSWFNERFLGKKLGMKRDGRTVFHSFRHNFDTMLERAGAPHKAIRQLMGHSLADPVTPSGQKGYNHPRSVIELSPVIRLISPELRKRPANPS